MDFVSTLIILAIDAVALRIETGSAIIAEYLIRYLGSLSVLPWSGGRKVIRVDDQTMMAPP